MLYTKKLQVSLDLHRFSNYILRFDLSFKYFTVVAKVELVIVLEKCRYHLTLNWRSFVLGEK